MRTEPIRILQIVSSLNAGSGVLSVVLNWHRHIDTTQIQFDYLYYIEVPVTRREEIERLGGRCYELPNPKRCPLKFLRESYRFFKQHRYRTIHSHITQLNFFFYPLAKLFGTKNIIQHAHGSRWGGTLFSGVRNYVMLHMVWPLITYKMACSKLAGAVYYGKNFSIVNNGIEIEKFIYNPKLREAKRKELGFENNFVIGHVGRFSAEKNHLFLLDILKDIIQVNPRVKLALVGNGQLDNKIKQAVGRKQLTDAVIFLDSRIDVAQLYQAFDVFVFPSSHEGLGIAAIEAQAAGLPCIFSDTLPKETFICNYKKLPLKFVKEWAQEIMSFTKDFKRVNVFESIKAAGFSAKEIAQQIQNFYLGVQK